MPESLKDGAKGFSLVMVSRRTTYIVAAAQVSPVHCVHCVCQRPGLSAAFTRCRLCCSEHGDMRVGSASPGASLPSKTLGPRVPPKPSSPTGAQSLSHGWLTAPEAEEHHGSLSTGVQAICCDRPKVTFYWVVFIGYQLLSPHNHKICPPDR